MWLADGWKDYEVIDSSDGEKLERWGQYILVRPDPQVIWDTPRTDRRWKHPNAHYHRSKKGGGEWEFFNLPEQWTIQYKDLTFNLKPFSFKHTGLFPEQAANWDWFGDKIRKAGRPIKVLNLFAYTGVATLHAAAGGAKETTTVDLSQTYLDWAARNLAANGFAFEVVDKPNRRDRTDGGSARGRRGGAANKLVRADVTRWIAEACRRHERYDLIFVDPPTFSNSKAMGRRTWDVQRDHVELLVGVSRLLADGGVAVFSCNLRTFKPDLEELARCGVEWEDITAQTIPHDFERNLRIHKCYLVRRK